MVTKWRPAECHRCRATTTPSTPCTLAWAGPTEPGAPHYYRLQGTQLLVEWDDTQRGANHAHPVLRDPVADFGIDVPARHHATHPH